MSGHGYIVCSPLQLLNALEAQRVFEAERRALVIVATRPVIDQMEPMIASDHWATIDRIATDPPSVGFGRRVAEIRGAARARRELDRVARTWQSVGHLFLGNLNSVYARHLANVVPHEALVVLDDGTATLDIAHRRREALGRHRSRRAAFGFGLRERLMGARGREPDRMVFFSSYDVEVGPNDAFVRNGFERLREQATRVGVGDEVLFLGQPLVGSGEMRADRYVAYVRAARDHLGSARFVYVPHRRESPDLIERLRAELGVAVRRPMVPIEVELIRSGRLPRVLAGFFSSALDNCRLMFGDVGMEIRALEIAPEHLEWNHAFVHRVYTYLRTQRGAGLEVDALPLPAASDESPAPTRAEPTDDRSAPSKRSEAWRS